MKNKIIFFLMLGLVSYEQEINCNVMTCIKSTIIMSGAICGQVSLAFLIGFLGLFIKEAQKPQAKTSSSAQKVVNHCEQPPTQIKPEMPSFDDPYNDPTQKEWNAFCKQNEHIKK